MPKLFPISLEVEEVALGKVIRILNKTPGIAKLNLNLRESAKKKLNGAHRVATQLKFPETAEEFIAQVIHGKGPMQTAALTECFTAAGRAGSSVASALHHAQKSGMIEKNEKKEWELTRKMKDRLRHRANKE